MADNPIEYSVVCIDNSDYMRNEDIRPNRFFAEKDAANIICHHILNSRPENRVAMVTLANTPQVIQSLTTNEINVMRKLYAIQMNGEIDLTVAIKIAILALKQISLKGLVTANKKQRIIVFIGSPLKKEQIQNLEGLVPKLNKLKISVDVISFGSDNQNQTQTLESVIKKLKLSHLVVVPNNRVMNNFLAESSILCHSRDVALVNENMDPELALAMKLSVEQNKNQFEEQIKRTLKESSQTAQSALNADSFKNDEELQRAIEMSLNFMKNNKIPTKGYKSRENHSKVNLKAQPNKTNETKGLTDEEQLALSLQMSLLESPKHSNNSSKEKKVKKKQPKKTNQKKSKNNGKQNP